VLRVELRQDPVNSKAYQRPLELLALLCILISPYSCDNFIAALT